MKTHNCCSEHRIIKFVWSCDAITRLQWIQARQIRFRRCRHQTLRHRMFRRQIFMFHTGMKSRLNWKLFDTKPLTFSVLELHRRFPEGRTAWQPLVQTRLTHFHTRFFQKTFTSNINSNINHINRRNKNNMSITHPRHPQEAVSVHNWLVINFCQQTMMKTLQFSIRWARSFLVGNFRPSQHFTSQTSHNFP